jgi:hypothetical protein
MIYPLDDQQFARISQMNAHQRFDEFVTKVTEHEQIWGLSSASGWAIVEAEGDDCFPVWPHPDFAAAWAKGDLADCTPQPIALSAWMQKWTAGMQKDGTLVLVFPTNGDTDEGLVVAPDELEDALLASLDKPKRRVV